jgi:hypothetical protein
MSSPFASGGGGGSSSSSPFASGSSKHGPLHFLSVIPGGIENFAEDVKDAAIGIPVGVIQGVRHPLRAAKMFEQATWHTWSPLFHGHPVKFAENVYAHPLAPLLDVATVFSLGLDIATAGLSSPLTAGLAGVRAAEVAGEVASETVLKETALAAPHTTASIAAKAGEASRDAKLTAVGGYGRLDRAAVRARDLRKGRSIPLEDPTGAGRLNEVRNLSPRPHRRLVQETFGHIAQHFPDVYANSRYNRAFVSTIAHRQFAKQASVAMVLKAGQALSDPETAAATRSELAAGHITGLHSHAPSQIRDAADLPKGYGMLADVRFIDKAGIRVAQRGTRAEAKAEAKRAAYADAAHSIPSLEHQLDSANEELRAMHDKGYLLSARAKSRFKEPTTKQLMDAAAVPVKEIEGNVARLEKQLVKARASKTQHDAAISELEQLASDRHAFEQRSWDTHFKQVGQDEETWLHHMTNAGSIYTTKTAAHAARDENGFIKIVPMHTLKNLGIEAERTSKMLKYLWDEPTRIWKMIQVGWSPRVVTNNFVGNWLLYALRENPVSGVAAVWDAVRATKGDKAAIEGWRSSGAHVRPWQHELFGTEIGNVFGRDLLGNTIGKGARIRQGFYPLVHKLADEPVRIAALSAFMRNDARVSALVKTLRKKHPKLSKYEALDQAVRQVMKEDPLLAQRAVEHVRATAGDYVTLSHSGRVIKQAVPFYLWDKHILRSTVNIVGDTPGRAAAIQGISNQGIEETRKLLGGAVPDFMEGAVPLSLLGINFGTHGNRLGILNTTGLNPFSTTAELSGFAEAALTGRGINPGEALLSQTTPLITSGVEYLSGTSLLTGNPKKREGNPLFGISGGIVDNISQVKTIKQLLSPKTELTSKGKVKLYAADDSSQLTGLLGIPLRSVDPGAAAGTEARQHPERKKKSKSPFTQGG